MARLKLFAQTLRASSQHCPLLPAPWQGVGFYKSPMDGALGIQVLLEELEKYIGLAVYTVKDI